MRFLTVFVLLPLFRAASASIIPRQQLACVGGQIWNSTSQQCECPSGQSWNGDQGQCTGGTSCTGGRVLDPATGSCACFGGFVWNEGTQACVAAPEPSPTPQPQPTTTTTTTTTINPPSPPPQSTTTRSSIPPPPPQPTTTTSRPPPSSTTTQQSSQPPTTTSQPAPHTTTTTRSSTPTTTQPSSAPPQPSTTGKLTSTTTKASPPAPPPLSSSTTTKPLPEPTPAKPPQSGPSWGGEGGSCFGDQYWNSATRRCDCPPGHAFNGRKCAYPALPPPVGACDAAKQYCACGKDSYALYNPYVSLCENDGYTISFCCKKDIQSCLEDYYPPTTPNCPGTQRYNAVTKTCVCPQSTYWDPRGNSCRWEALPKPRCGPLRKAYCGKSRADCTKYDVHHPLCENNGQTMTWCSYGLLGRIFDRPW